MRDEWELDFYQFSQSQVALDILMTLNYFFMGAADQATAQSMAIYQDICRNKQLLRNADRGRIFLSQEDGSGV